MSWKIHEPRPLLLRNKLNRPKVLISIVAKKIDKFLFFSRYFCETLLDFYDPCPVKEELRLKIVGRLIKEGSNADEPANIALSDYSSLR